MRAPVLLLLVLALAAGRANADEQVLTFDGEVPADDASRFVELPFEVPAGIAEIEVRHDDLSEANILDWGLFDPLGSRGWGGGNTEPAVVGVLAASRSYLTGPILRGTWKVRIGEAKLAELPARYHVEVVLRDAPTLAPQNERIPYEAASGLAAGPHWFAGDLHVHSLESGDASPTLDEIADYARGRGLDFVELSDHNTTSQLDFITDAQSRHPDLLFVPGVEFTTYGGHANGIGATEWVDHAIGLPGVTIEGAARAFADQHAVFSINHPTLDIEDFCIGCAWSWDLPGEWIGGIEITTGGYSESGWLLSGPATEMWDALSSQGHHVTAVGGSDDHSAGTSTGGFSSPIGDPTTMVWAEQLSAAAIVEGIRAGRTVVKLQGPDDPMVVLTSSVAPEGDTVSAPSVVLRAVVTGGGDRLLLLRNGETVERLDIDDDPFTRDFPLDAPATGEDFVRAVVIVDDAPRTVTSNLWLRTGPLPTTPSSSRAVHGGGCAVVASGGSAGPGAVLLVVALGMAAGIRRKAKAPAKRRPTAKRRRVPKAAPAPVAPVARRSFPIIGIGASAGGLEALEQFFGQVPQPCGMAFVVVQHMDPTHEGMMVELLQRATPMKVAQIRDRVVVEPGRIYVIPPGRDLALEEGRLLLRDPVAPRGLRLPIDSFFRSLAEAQQERAVGVILSGMGSDGTLGAGAIKEHAGAVFVQAPASAKFDAMPRSAMDAGHADVVAPVEELPARIATFVGRIPVLGEPDLALGGKAQAAIQRVCALLRTRTGQDFSQYKRSTLARRIERRMGLHQIDGIAEYVKTLQDSPQETQLLFKELLIGVTCFFRDPETWEHLKKTVLPALLAERPARGELRAWVAGCSTGEEAYSLAILFREVLGELRPARNVTLQIFATDLDKDAIDRARQGLYPSSIEADVSAERLRRFFVRDEPGYRVSHEIREMVVFAPQNLIMDPPFTKLDVLTCRNLLIYLAPEIQKRLLPLFHHCLNPGGVLVLGSAETTGAASDLFTPLAGRARTYRRVETSLAADRVEFPPSFHARFTGPDAPALAKASAPNLPALADRLLLDHYSPAAVLTNAKGDILYVSGHTGRYLEPAAGKANWNVHAMAREGLRYELGVAFQKAIRGRRAVVRSGVEVLGSTLAVDVTVEPLREPDALGGMVIIVFSDAPAAPAPERPTRGRPTPAALARSERELRKAREELLTTREEMQTSQEELKSTNEELQSTNEELQSTNEELTTSKEEMQSLNEELQTVNHELQAKVDDLSRANDDMRNLLDSTDIATLFLDGALNVRRFTAQMTSLIRLAPGDVNRPITDLASDLAYPALAADAREVLRTLVLRETPVQTVDGRWFSVRIMPYRTLDNRIDGVVITFVDITTAKKLEATLRQQ